MVRRLPRLRLYGRLVGLTWAIYAAIVVVWAIFLYRLALQRQDRAAQHHSMERFSSAMRVLSRGGRPAGVYPEIENAGEHAEGSLVPQCSSETLSENAAEVSTDYQTNGPTVSSRSDGSDADQGSGEPVSSPSVAHGSTLAPRSATSRMADRRRAASAAAGRRRRVMFVLLGLSALTGMAAVLGMVAWWGLAVPLALMVIFLCVARRQVSLAEERYWAEAARSRPESSNVIRRSAARVDASHGSPRELADDEHTVILPIAAVHLQDERVNAVPLTTADGGSLWDPVAITLPTYIEKAVAKRTIRTVDLSGANTWSAGHSASVSKTVGEAEAEAARAIEREADAPCAANG